MAVTFALAVLPLIGAVGMAIDYTDATNVRSYMQNQADAAALSGAQLGPDGDAAAYLEYLRAAAAQRYGEGEWIDDMTVDGKWIGTVDYQVTVTATMPTSIIAAVPGMPHTVDIGVTSTVRVAEPREVYKPPVVSELDNEAGDYNRLYVYCYDPTQVKGKGKAKGQREKARTQMTAFADNAGTKYDYEMPRCEGESSLSFKLLNVRLAREDPGKWDSPHAQKFEYFSDTEIKKNKYKYDFDGAKILETVICDDLDECKPKSKGGIIPEGKEREPVQAKETCSPGKYIYYGWEDRAPGMKGPSNDWTDVAWTDRDYDDLRIIMSCPTLETVEDRLVRLVR